MPNFVGGTEFFAENVGIAWDQVRMALAHQGIYVLHARQVHEALAEAVEAYRTNAGQDILRASLIRAAEFVTRMLGVEHPRLALARLSPEQFDPSWGRTITTALSGAFSISEYPASEAFVRVLLGQADLYLALHHDQGHIPLKLTAAILDERKPAQRLPAEWRAPSWNSEQGVLAMGRVNIYLADDDPLQQVIARFSSDPAGMSHRVYEAILKANEQERLRGHDRPLILVAALNPHSGEEGRFGQDDQHVILPALQKAAALGIAVRILKGADGRAIGPVPADAVFIQALNQRANAVIAMYRDQAELAAGAYAAVAATGRLRPRPLIAGVSFTAGLANQAVRVSVDHGTAEDIAWKKGNASVESLRQVWETAADLVKKKYKYADSLLANLFRRDWQNLPVRLFGFVATPVLIQEIFHNIHHYGFWKGLRRSLLRFNLLFKGHAEINQTPDSLLAGPVSNFWAGIAFTIAAKVAGDLSLPLWLIGWLWVAGLGNLVWVIVETPLSFILGRGDVFEAAQQPGIDHFLIRYGRTLAAA